MLFEIEGLEIIGVAQDGIEARDRILELKPDVLILDIRMPWPGIVCRFRSTITRRRTARYSRWRYPGAYTPSVSERLCAA